MPLAAVWRHKAERGEVLTEPANEATRGQWSLPELNDKISQKGQEHRDGKTRTLANSVGGEKVRSGRLGRSRFLFKPCLSPNYSLSRPTLPPCRHCTALLPHHRTMASQAPDLQGKGHGRSVEIQLLTSLSQAQELV